MGYSGFYKERIWEKKVRVGAMLRGVGGITTTQTPTMLNT